MFQSLLVTTLDVIQLSPATKQQVQSRLTQPAPTLALWTLPFKSLSPWPGDACVYPGPAANAKPFSLTSSCCMAIDKLYFLQNTFMFFFISKLSSRCFGSSDRRDYCILQWMWFDFQIKAILKNTLIIGRCFFHLFETGLDLPHCLPCLFACLNALLLVCAAYGMWIYFPTEKWILHIFIQSYLLKCCLKQAFLATCLVKLAQEQK